MPYFFKEAGVYVINLMSSPDAGKTFLLEKTILAIKDRIKVGVIEGDITGTNDAERIDRLGVPVIQINTIDLRDLLDVSVDKIKKDAQFLNPKIKIFEISCKTVQGIEEWTSWLMTNIS